MSRPVRVQRFTVNTASKPFRNGAEQCRVDRRLASWPSRPAAGCCSCASCHILRKMPMHGARRQRSADCSSVSWPQPLCVKYLDGSSADDRLFKWLM